MARRANIINTTKNPHEIFDFFSVSCETRGRVNFRRKVDDYF